MWRIFLWLDKQTGIGFQHFYLHYWRTRCFYCGRWFTPIDCHFCRRLGVKPEQGIEVCESCHMNVYTPALQRERLSEAPCPSPT